MKTLKRLIGNIPRKVRIAVDIVLILLILFLFYLSIGTPALTTEQAFRRAEKMHMVGPSEILDTLDWGDYPMFDTLIVAETDEIIVFYREFRMYDYTPWPKLPKKQSRESVFTYREKTGDITVLGAPVSISGIEILDYVRSYPVYVFDDYPEAVRAELEITVTGIKKSSKKEYRFSAEADRRSEGFFRFTLDSGDGKAVDFIAHVSTGDSLVQFLTDEENMASIPVTVRLYDENNALIVEKELFIRSPAAQARTQNEPGN